MVALRRDLHMHPELSWVEHRTTEKVADLFTGPGLTVTRLESTGLVVDIGRGPHKVALRADLDALPVSDLTDDPWASTVDGVAHACGHDLHTAVLVGAGLALAEVGEALPQGVRLIFQPAEESMPGGAMQLIDHGVLDNVAVIFGLHADPSLEVGDVGLRVGPLTGAADAVDITLAGRGGHTSRPHLTEDLTFALGKIVTELPAILSRRMDPRAGVSVVWGSLRAGSTNNVIPAVGEIKGTVRMLDDVSWDGAGALVTELIDQIVAPYGVTAVVNYRQGVPPVVNDATATEALSAAARVGGATQVPTQQSLGGEDFAWYLRRVRGAMARLGTRSPGGPVLDLHQGTLRIDDDAVSIGSRLLALAAVGTVD
ncbi:M20 family metallopeptidase [soil metagenome]